MDCATASDFVCRALGWSKDIGLDLTQFEEALRQVWLASSRALNDLVDLAMTHAEKLFGLAGFAFGVWRWWYYRERVLHKRLQEYLSEQETRLHRARAYVLEAIMRPGPKRRFAEPLFAVKPLRVLLRRRGWRLLFGARTVELGAERLLRRALRKIASQLETTEATLASLYDQRASAFILRGAIAAARAGDLKAPHRSAGLDRDALDDFRFALQIPGKHQVEAKEYEAHQLRRLGNLREAESAYRELEALAVRILEGQARDLMRARARRWLASITQAQALRDFRRGHRPSARSPLANRLMTGERSALNDGDGVAQIDMAGALQLRAPYSRQFQSWDTVEQGDMHYLAAFIYHELGFNRKEGKQLDLAETSYKGVTDQTPVSRWFVGGSTKHLRMAARAGMERVREAQDSSTYDTAWLLPPLDQPQSPSTTIGNAGCDQSVPEAAKHDRVD